MIQIGGDSDRGIKPMLFGYKLVYENTFIAANWRLALPATEPIPSKFNQLEL